MAEVKYGHIYHLILYDIRYLEYTAFEMQMQFMSHVQSFCSIWSVCVAHPATTGLPSVALQEEKQVWAMWREEQCAIAYFKEVYVFVCLFVFSFWNSLIKPHGNTP